MPFARGLTSVLLLLPAACICQIPAASIPTGTPLALTLDRNYPMRANEPISAQLIYPIYAQSVLALPAGTIITGRVLALHRDHTRRLHAILGGDFTPFRTPEVTFTAIQLPDGTSIPILCGPSASGTQIYRAVAPPPTTGGFLHREIATGVTVVRSDIANFTAPGKADRLLQFIYGELPYHPQRIPKGTSWTVETTASLNLPAQPALPPQPPAPAHKTHFWQQPTPPTEPLANNTGSWMIHANLSEALSSETSSTAQPIQATVAEPIFNPDHTIAVPQGAVLTGVVTRAKPARRFGRTGTLSFRFNQLQLPNASPQAVETRLTGADSAANIALNSEGRAQSKTQDKLAVPIFLALLAARPLDQDGGHEHHMAAKNATGGAAGLGLVGTIVGLAGGSPYAAAGIGYWGAARAFYSRWLGRGQKITFAKDTRIIVETTPRRSAPMTPR